MMRKDIDSKLWKLVSGLLPLFLLMLLPINVSAQDRSDVRQVITEAYSRNSPKQKVNRLLPLADELMLMSSFDDVAQKLVRERYKVEIEDDQLKAESEICQVVAVNRQNLPEKIDTLTLFVKYQLNKPALEDSLKNCSYVFKQKSADGRFDWWQQKGTGINLAVYYTYNNKYPSALLFARPKPKAVAKPEVVDEPTPPEPEEPPAVTPESQVMNFASVSVSEDFRYRDINMSVSITFPQAVGGSADQLNSEALNSSLLGRFVQTKPSLAGDGNIEKGVEAYLKRMKNEFLKDYASADEMELSFKNSYDITILPEAESRKGVVTYVNNVSMSDVDTDLPHVAQYRVAANFELRTGKLITFDDVFKENSHASIAELLRRAHQEKIAGLEEDPVGELEYDDALENFILGRDSIIFILISVDETGGYEEVYSYKYDKLKKFLK